MYELHLLCPNDRLNPTQTKSSKTLGSGDAFTPFLFISNVLCGNTHNLLIRAFDVYLVVLGYLLETWYVTITCPLLISSVSQAHTYIYRKSCTTATTKANEMAQ